VRRNRVDYFIPSLLLQVCDRTSTWHSEFLAITLVCVIAVLALALLGCLCYRAGRREYESEMSDTAYRKLSSIHTDLLTDPLIGQ
jgi:predicted permease